MSEEIFYNSPVQMIVPKKVEDKAYTVLKSKREKLVKECKTQSTNSDGRGSHSREAGYLLRIRALTSDCLSLIPRDGCRTVEKRAEFWTKLELINEAIQQTIRHANEWDNTHQNDLQSSFEQCPFLHIFCVNIKVDCQSPKLSFHQKYHNQLQQQLLIKAMRKL